MHSTYSRLISGLLLIALIYSASCLASVQVIGTRFVYSAAEQEIVVTLNNSGKRPSLVQSWLDNGDPTSEPGSQKTPFVILPPLTRIEAGKRQTLRIAHIRDNSLPSDRESVFWLSVLDIPPKAQGLDGKNTMKLAFRTRLKLFYRPEGLSGTPKDAAKNLTWSLVPSGKGFALRAQNNSAFYVSFGQLSLKSNSGTYSPTGNVMVAPKSTQDFPLKGLSSRPKNGFVEGDWLDDFGAARSQHYTLSF